MNKNLHTQPNIPDEFLENLANVRQVFLSFAVRTDPVNFNLLLNNFANKPDDVIYFSQPDKKTTFLSFDELTVQSFNKNEFQLITREIGILKNKLISNHDEFPGISFPTFVISAKFPGNKSSEEWNDFGTIDFIVPKISLYKYCDDYFILYNVLTESFSGHENLNELLEHHIDNIHKLESKLTSSGSGEVKLAFLEQSDNRESWKNKIEILLESIISKETDKVVLSRRIKYEAPAEFNWENIFGTLDRKYPSCTNFLLKSNESVFFGSTPELLARFSGKNFFTEALAGSIMRGNDSDEDSRYENELLNSAKNKVEHDSVTNHIINSLKDYLENVETDKNAVVKKLFYIQHLQTGIRGTLKAGTNALDIIASFFPTPAVCGIPKEKAIELIDQLENFERGLFAGLLGWLNCEGNGEFNVTIRAALLKKHILHSYAGCGIVEGSEPDEEFDETILKLKPILSLFNNAD